MLEAIQSSSGTFFQGKTQLFSRREREVTKLFHLVFFFLLYYIEQSLEGGVEHIQYNNTRMERTQILDKKMEINGN